MHCYSISKIKHSNNVAVLIVCESSGSKTSPFFSQPSWGHTDSTVESAVSHMSAILSSNLLIVHVFVGSLPRDDHSAVSLSGVTSVVAKQSTYSNQVESGRQMRTVPTQIRALVVIYIKYCFPPGAYSSMPLFGQRPLLARVR